MSPTAHDDDDHKFVKIISISTNTFIKNVLINLGVGYMSYVHILWYWDIDMTWFEIVLVLMMFGCFWLRMWSYYVLGDLFTYKIGIMNEHQLITYGPYTYLAHPGYTSQTLFVWILLLYYEMYWLLPISIMLMTEGILSRIYVEDKMLGKKFGAEHQNYLKNVYKFIPFIY